MSYELRGPNDVMPPDSTRYDNAYEAAEDSPQLEQFCGEWWDEIGDMLTLWEVFGPFDTMPDYLKDAIVRWYYNEQREDVTNRQLDWEATP